LSHGRALARLRTATLPSAFWLLFKSGPAAAKVSPLSTRIDALMRFGYGASDGESFGSCDNVRNVL
jgi:hypothetical protein